MDEQEQRSGGAPHVFRRRVPIRWRDMDAFGHANNAVYLTYVEEAHDEFLGATVGDGDGSAHVVMARIELDFIAPLTQDDEHVVVSCRLESLGSSSIRTAEEIVAADGRCAARSRSVMVKVERGSGRSLPLSAEERAALSGG